MVFHIALEFCDYDEPFVRKMSESDQIGRAVDSRRCTLGLLPGKAAITQKHEFAQSALLLPFLSPKFSEF